MTIPKNVLEWRKTHPRPLEEQSLPPQSLEELKEQWDAVNTNLKQLVESLRACENK